MLNEVTFMKNNRNGLKKISLPTIAIVLHGLLTASSFGQVSPANANSPAPSTIANRYSAAANQLPGCNCQTCGMRMQHPDPLCVTAPNQATGLTAGACTYCLSGIDCANSNGTEQRWKDAGRIDFEPLRHGEYIGPVRLPAMLEYRARVGDEFQFIFVLTREKIGEDYRLMVGDEILVESVSDESIKRGDFVRGIQIQSDGTVVLRLIGPIQAAGKTVPQLRKDIEKAYADYLKNPSIDVTPIKTNTRLDDLRSAVSNFIGVNGGQNIFGIVNPDGRLQLPLVGSVYIVGMTMEEIIFSLKHYWRFVNSEPLELKALSHEVGEKAA